MCTFKPTGGTQCPRSNVGGTDYCALHYGHDLASDRPLPTNPAFQVELDKLVAAKDGNWQGFVFPAGCTLPKVISFPVRAVGCQFASLTLDGVTFQESVDFSGSLFRTTTIIRGLLFQAPATFDRCRFAGPVDFLNVQYKQAASFHRAEFADRTVLRANFEGSANFNEVVFRDAVTFAGWRNVTAKVEAALGAVVAVAAGVAIGGKPPTLLQRTGRLLTALTRRIQSVGKHLFALASDWIQTARTRYRSFLRRFAKDDAATRIFRVFEREGQLQGVIFMKPEQTSFSQLDLSCVYLRGTNLRGVRFLGVDWWQPLLGRNGLHDEIFVRESKDGPFKHAELPSLEETCRNVRVALEESRSFNIASDFYIAEMEAARSRLPFFRKHLFSIPALYFYASRYGTSVWVASAVLALLFLAYVAAMFGLQTESSSLTAAQNASDIALQALRLLVFQSNDALAPGTDARAWVSTIFRVFGLIQIAMLIFAFRARIKRS
jgi:uncharacterized protein YjbI with pentapeptide repeats